MTDDLLRRRARALGASLSTLLFLVPGLAVAQGADFGAKKSASEDSQEGLESATPTDNVNELDSGLNASGNHGGEAGNHSPAEDNAGGFDVNAAKAKSDTNTNPAGAGAGDNALFDGGNAAPSSHGSPAVNAFGNGSDPAAASNANAAKAKAANAAPLNNVPVTTNAAPANTAPANAVPTNASSNLPANTAPLGEPGPATGFGAAPAVAPPAAAAVTGQEDLVAPPSGPPPVEALPLPPPNEFAGAPPVPGTMRLMAEGEAPEEYLVEPGDSLYDICDQLLDEAGYWPKLWALNPEIKNPHFIFPNMRLRFYPGDDETPPYLQVVTEDDVIPIDKGSLQEEQLIAEKIIFTPEETAADTVTEVIGPEGVEPLQDEILTSGRLYDGRELEVHVPGFIYRSEREAVAKVIGGRAGDIAAGPDIEVDVAGESSLAAGSLLTILRRGEDVKSPDTGDFIGYKYYYIANIRLARALADGIYRGKVQDIRLPVQADDLVVAYISTKRVIPLGGSIGPLRPTPAAVVGWELPQQEIGGAGNYAFIGKGNGDGLAPGMVLPLFSTPDFLSLSSGSLDLPVDYELIGAMRIIDVTDGGAVGYVLRNAIEVKIGDRTNKGS